MNTPIEDLKTYKVSEIFDYQINFHIVQNEDKSWVPCFQFTPSLKNSSFGLIQDKELLPKIGVVKKINDIDTILIYSKDKFSQWEYAAEEAIDAINNFGFIVNDGLHFFEVMYWNTDNLTRATKKAVYDGSDFRLAKEGE